MRGGIYRFGWILSAAMPLAGCMVGPDYHRPDAPVAPEYKELAGWTAAAPADAAPKGDWWTDFHDDLLDQLEPMVALSNQTVRQNYFNYQAALAEVKLAQSEFFPTIGLTASATRARGAATSGSSGVANSGSLEGSASWTLDLWGQVRRLIEENKATAQADEATLANATLSEQSLLATTVIELRLADANIDLQQSTVDAYRASLTVTESQGAAGIAATPPSAVITARVALETALANLISLGVARAQYAHAIAVLVGKNPEDLDIPHGHAMPSLPAVPAGVPSTLLQRRPDIAAAERTMAAGNAAVGVAVAAYYPTLSLSAAAGFSQSPLAGLLHAANHIWSVGASGSESLIDFGYRHAEVQAAKASYEATVASYRGTVLNAFADVENDLSNLTILAEQARALEIAITDAKLGTQIAMEEYRAGTVDYTTVALAQQTELADQQSALSVQLSRLVDTVSLITDLGGGWSTAQLHGRH
jgi:NodT family efflux transporter outer membrane factor (OMF) lipoprotein